VRYETPHLVGHITETGIPAFEASAWKKDAFLRHLAPIKRRGWNGDWAAKRAGARETSCVAGE
jgi:hypothetical protein